MKKQLEQPDRVVWRPEVCSNAGVVSTTLSRWMLEGKLPKPDVYMTRKRYGWRLSTLRKHGVNWV
ncbi:MAG: hypothetical protein FWH15_08195 [Betaproteobacteria bacterium]|nr:hypothetical protein [Betaproteobacteria bacterium]